MYNYNVVGMCLHASVWKKESESEITLIMQVYLLKPK